MKAKNRFLALTLVIALGLTMLFSVCYIASNSGHDCVGEGCPVCERISLCESALKLLICVGAAIFVCAAQNGVFARLEKASLRPCVSATLVSSKVKLSD